MKFLETLKKYQQQILLVLFVMLLFRSCGTGSELTKLRKEVESQRQVLNNLPTKKDLQIEGLKSEKRMIQATDRKMLDVQRQSEIDNSNSISCVCINISRYNPILIG
jgi:thiamine biosynthesis lipoprotein ApbE